jgi:hypothetical protein
MPIPALLLALALAAAPQQAPERPPIGSIETFGLRAVPRSAVLEATGIEPGAQAQIHSEELLARLRSLEGVADASASLVTVDDQTILYVGIREDGAPRGPVYRAPPTGTIRLPEEIVAAYEALLATLPAAIAAGETREDHGPGHAMMEFAPGRAQQERFVELAAAHLEVLGRVLREAGDETHRRSASMVIAYAPDKQRIVEDLVYASNDADPTVRNNAVRNLSVLVDWAATQGRRIEIDPQPFLSLLGSLEWSDRNKGLALLTLRGLDADTVPTDQREELLASLAEMAQWQTMGHCLPAALLLGRLAGRSDMEIFMDVRGSEGDRAARAKWVEQLLDAASKSG